MSKPFAKEQELQETLKRLKQVNAELKIGESNNNGVVEIDDEDDIDIEENEIQRKREYVR